MTGPSPVRVIRALAILAGLVVLVVGCGGHSVDPAAWRSSSMLAVVADGDRTLLVGLDPGTKTTATLAELPVPGVAGGVLSYALERSDGSAILWIETTNSDQVDLFMVDRAKGAITKLGVTADQVFPELVRGDVYSVSGPGSGVAPHAGRLSTTTLAVDDAMPLPGQPGLAAADQAAGMLLYAIERTDGLGDRLVTVAIDGGAVAELTVPQSSLLGSVVANGRTIVASVRGRAPGPGASAAPSDVGTSSDVLVFELGGKERSIEVGEAPGVLALSAGRLVAGVGLFDAPGVVEVTLVDGAIVNRWSVVARERIVSIAVDDKAITVLQDRHVVFIDRSSGQATTVDLPGDTQTIWRFGRL